jgi:hypothetical protein
VNVKAHIRATEDTQPDQTDGGALCDASCSASSLLDKLASGEINADEYSNRYIEAGLARELTLEDVERSQNPTDPYDKWVYRNMPTIEEIIAESKALQAD